MRASPEHVTPEQLDNDEIFHSIINSERQFDTLLVDTCRLNKLDQFWKLKTICYKYGPTIEKFSWESCKMTKTDIVSLLNFMPGITTLSIGAWSLQCELYEEPVPDLNLPVLDTLKIIRSDKATIEFFTTFLPKNTIKDLDLQCDPEDFLINQQSVRKLQLTVDIFNPQHLSSMELVQLKLKLRRYKVNDGRSLIHEVICRQPNLTNVDLMSCEGCFDGDNEAFSAVCDLDKLICLKLNIDDLSSDAFVEHFGKLKNLTSLELESVEHNYAPVVAVIDELSHIKMTNLEELKLYLNDVGVVLDRVERIGRNFPKLRSFNVRCERPLPLDCYLQNMHQLTTLNVDYHYTKEFSKLCNNFEFKHETLRHLYLQGFGFGSDDVNWNELVLMQLSESLPKLETLELDAAFPFNTEFIVKILGKFSKLKVLRNWSMVQSSEHCNRFDRVSVYNLIKIASLLNKFSIELRLKAIDMDVSRIKEDLGKDFNVALSRFGSFIVVRLDKK